MLQREQIKQHLLKHKRITSWTAIQNYGITRLAEYIRQLRSAGMDIQMERIYKEKKQSFVDKLLSREVEKGKWYGLYTIK